MKDRVKFWIGWCISLPLFSAMGWMGGWVGLVAVVTLCVILMVSWLNAPTDMPFVRVYEEIPHDES